MTKSARLIAMLAALSLSACDTTASYEETPPGTSQTGTGSALIPILALLVVGSVVALGD